MQMKTTNRVRSDSELLDDIAADRDEPVGPAVDGQALQQLARARAAREDADADIRAAVGAARGAGASWAVIGAVLGVSRQAALKRFG